VENSRHRNRETVILLFQGVLADFGNQLGGKIMWHIAYEAGGQRIRVPRISQGVNQYATSENDPLYGCSPCFRKLWQSTCQKFGKATGRVIMLRIITVFGGGRIYFPSFKMLHRFERNAKIRNLYGRDELQ